MIKIHVFHTGSVRVDQAIPHHESNPLAVTGFMRGKSKKMILPVSCYLIQHPQGNILIDTGWDTIYAKEKPKQKMGLVNKISGPIIKETEGVDSKLKAIGIRPAELDCVYISHMDFDHTSGLRLVKEAKQIKTSEEEWKACNQFGLRYIDAWTGICRIDTFAYQNTGIGPFARSYDVYGDGSIELVATPGHSKGLFSVKVSGNDKYVVLGNDAAYTQQSFEKHIIPGFAVDSKNAEKSLDWLCECREDPNCLEVLVNHDPTVKEHVIEL